MLLTLSTTHRPAGDLGYLLGKYPGRVQSFSLSFGQAHVFYPEASDERCTACLLLDVDSVSMVRGRGRNPGFALSQYVNDRPYVASSLMSVAIAKVLRSAMAGVCKDRPELAATPIPLAASLEVLPVRGSEGMVARLFEPLGYEVSTQPHALDETFIEWGESPYQSVSLRGTVTLSQLLSHLYVLIPVFDNRKHYFVSEEEIEKLLAKGEGWLTAHPEREFITRRYLKNRRGLVDEALARLMEDADVEPDPDAPDMPADAETTLEQPIRLHDQRLQTVLDTIRASGASTVVDLGCGSGKLLRLLLDDWQFSRIVGVDVTVRSLEIAARRLRLDRLPPTKASRLELVHGSLMYRDERFEGFDAAAVVEVIEHLDPPRLAAFERVLFAHARPGLVVLTTPNAEYNVRWESLPAGEFRHPDHRFEWTRGEFAAWADRVATEHGYAVRHEPIGPWAEAVGSPSQMAVFERRDEETAPSK